MSRRPHNADPLADITNTTTIRAVIANGRYFDRAALDQLLTEVQAKGKVHTEMQTWMQKRGRLHEEPREVGRRTSIWRTHNGGPL